MSAPAGAADRFGDRWGQAQRYADWLTGPGIERGLLGPREAERIWSRHLLNSAALAGLLPPGAAVADLGSGAGLPGVPVWLARPDTAMTLIEPLARRATFLQEVVRDLDLPIRVTRARAEDVADTFDVVIARAVAPLDRLARWARPLLGESGSLLALKGESAEAELHAHEQAVRQLGATVHEVHRVPAVDGEQATVIVVRFSGKVSS